MRLDISRWLDWLWFLAWTGLSTGWCLATAATLGSTFDESIYLQAGLDGWRRGSHEPMLRMGTMPLPVDLATLPLFVSERLSGDPIDLRGPDADTYLFLARTTNLIFWWQLLLFARIVGRHLAGPWGGRLAVAFIAVEPNFVAHASLATTDIAAAAFLLPAAYYFARGRDQANGWRRIGLPGLWFGLALFAKASALAYGPLCWFLIEAHRLWTRTLPPGWAKTSGVRPLVAQLGPWWRDSWRVGVVGLVVVFVLCGCDWRPQSSFVRWAQALPQGVGKDALVWLAENLAIFSNAGHGLVYQIRHNLRGHATFLLGDAAARSLWYYYPVLLTIKLPAPLLILPVLLLVLRPRALGNWACVVAAGLLVYSLNCRVQIGIRLMLPWIAIGIVGLAAALVNACSDSGPGWRRRGLLTLGAAGLAWLVGSLIAIGSHGLRYVNEFWGGPERGYELVSDSNYDWGQGLQELAAWQEGQGIESLDVWYFGTDARLSRLPMRPLAVATMTESDLLQAVQGRHLAVSVTWLYGSYAPPDSTAVALLRSRRPAARTSTFLIFDFSR